MANTKLTTFQVRNKKSVRADILQTDNDLHPFEDPGICVYIYILLYIYMILCHIYVNIYVYIYIYICNVCRIDNMIECI